MLSGPDRGRGFEMLSELIIFRIEFPIEGRQGKIMGWGGTIDKGNVTVEDTKVQCDLLEANTKVLFQSNGNVFLIRSTKEMIYHREEIADVQSSQRQNSARITRTDPLLRFALETTGDP